LPPVTGFAPPLVLGEPPVGGLPPDARRPPVFSLIPPVVFFSPPIDWELPPNASEPPVVATLPPLEGAPPLAEIPPVVIAPPTLAPPSVVVVLFEVAPPDATALLVPPVVALTWSTEMKRPPPQPTATIADTRNAKRLPRRKHIRKLRIKPTLLFAK